MAQELNIAYLPQTDAEGFMQWLEEEIHRHSFLSDPFIHTMSVIDELSRHQAAQFAMLYYPHIMRTRLYQANALGIAEDEYVQFALAEILHDEYGNGDFSQTHPEIYRKFMRAVGVDEDSIAAGGIIIPELAVYIDAMMRLSQSGDWLAAAAAVGIASEWPIPALYQRLLLGLRTVPGVNESDLELFTGHVVLDIEHSRLMREALLSHAQTPRGQQRILQGVQANLDARRIFMQGLYREIFA